MKKQTKFYAKICPKCRSLNVAISHQGSLSGLVALGLPTVYRCKDCGFAGNFFPEVNFNEMKKKSKNKK